MIFETERLYLRRINISDVEAFYDIMGNDKTMYYLGKTLSKEEVEYYINDLSNKKFNDIEGEYAIVLKNTNEVIGLLNININKRDLRAEISYLLNSNYWKKGYAYEIVNYIVNYLFKIIKINKITADCDIANIASSKLLEKIGMEKEGVLKQHRFNRRTKSFYDVAVYGVLSK